MEIEDEIFIEDDQDILDIINFGFPRRRYDRSDYFNSMDNMSFFRRFRLTKPSVLQLLELIEDEIEFNNDLNDSVTPINQILTTLRLYSCGGHQTAIGDFVGAHQTTISRIVRRVTNAIARLSPQFITMPEERERLEIGTSFYNVARFPKVLGCIDGTHIKIQFPCNKLLMETYQKIICFVLGGPDGEIYRNRKSFFSMNTQILCDHNLKIRDIVARWPGSAHDQTIFNNSRIRARLENNEFPDCVILGDSGYTNKNYILTPCLNPANRAEQLYNESHIRTRNTVERQIGVWKRRFPILAYGSRYGVEPSCNIIVATAVLHNLAINNNEEFPQLPEDIHEEEMNYLIVQGNVHYIPPEGVPERNVFNFRQNLINNYFRQL